MRCDNAHANCDWVWVWVFGSEWGLWMKATTEGEREGGGRGVVGNKSTIYCCCGRVELSISKLFLSLSLSVSARRCCDDVALNFCPCCGNALRWRWRCHSHWILGRSTSARTNFDPKKCLANRSEVKGLYFCFVVFFLVHLLWYLARRHAQSIIISNHFEDHLKSNSQECQRQRLRGREIWRSEELQLKLIWKWQRCD